MNSPTDTDIEAMDTDIEATDTDIEAQHIRAERFLAKVKRLEDEAVERKPILKIKFQRLRELKELKERFPEIDDEMLECIYSSCNYSLEFAIIQLNDMMRERDEERQIAEIIRIQQEEEQQRLRVIEQERKIQRLMDMREGIGRMDLDEYICRDLLEQFDWDLTQVVLSLLS